MKHVNTTLKSSIKNCEMKDLFRFTCNFKIEDLKGILSVFYLELHQKDRLNIALSAFEWDISIIELLLVKLYILNACGKPGG